MGYDFHITRRNDWSCEGKDITAEEWLAYVRGDAELTLAATSAWPYWTVWRGPSKLAEPWLDWSSGQIYTKNPDSLLIDKMISIAEALDARVLGDDGEIYDERASEQFAEHTPRNPVISLRQRVAGWLSRWLAPRTVVTAHEPVPFGVGDRVRDMWGHEHRVILIDPTAEHGMGVIRTVRFDGTELAHSMVAHGLIPLVQRGSQP
jgi:hypothetical protein